MSEDLGLEEYQSQKKARRERALILAKMKEEDLLEEELTPYDGEVLKEFLASEKKRVSELRASARIAEEGLNNLFKRNGEVTMIVTNGRPH